MSDIITVDAGHSGATYNKGAAPGYYESKTMWDLHLRFAEALAAYGPATRLTRTALDANPGLIARGEMAKGSKAFISFHSNAEATGKADYPLGIYFVDDNCGSIDEESKELAKALSNTVAETIGTTQAARIWTRSSDYDRDGNGYNDDWYGVLRGAHSVGVPGIILECGFHTHSETAAWLMDPNNRQKLAEALAKTVADVYGYKKPAASTAPINKGGTTMIEMKTLHKGDEGAQVVFLQRFLIGYSEKTAEIINAAGGADGKFGSATEKALIIFQSENVDAEGKQLVADGVAGEKTFGAITGQKK